MPTPLQQEFLRKLKEVLRARKLRQTDIAAALGVTSSAVSQIMHGKSRLSPENFQKIEDKFALPPLECHELSRMLQCIQSGTERYYSLWNHRIFSCRNARNLSLIRVSISTGIPVDRLRDLEENYTARPTDDEILGLKKIFAHLEAPSEAADPFSPDPFVPIFPEEPLPQDKLPLLPLYDCSEYQPGTDLAAFAAEHTRRHCLHTVITDAKNPIAVAASGRALGFPYPGTILLILAEIRPIGFSKLQLCCSRNGRFFLKNSDARDDELSPWLLDAPAEAESAPRWALPVLELCFTPVDIRSFDHGLF